MSVWTRRPALRWLVPATVVALAVGGGAAASALPAGEDGPDLPPRTAAELLTDLQTAQVGALSGTVVTTADLGLPVPPDPGRGSDRHDGADLGSIWSGSNTWRVWYDGPERVRLALLGTLSQADIIRNETDVWLWDSAENKATHWELPEGAFTGAAPHPGAAATPQQAAEAALAAIDPTTEVSADDTTRVAERDAYELVLAPRDGASQIRQVRLAVDAQESIPLGVQVYGDGADPAIEVRFTQISFAAPDPEQFRFNPPPGTEVIEGGPMSALPLLDDLPVQVTVVGEGWTRVLVIRLPDELPAEHGLDMLDMLLPEGEALSGSLFSVLRTDDGRVLAGLVTPERLAEAADDPAAQEFPD